MVMGDRLEYTVSNGWVVDIEITDMNGFLRCTDWFQMIGMFCFPGFNLISADYYCLKYLKYDRSPDNMHQVSLISKAVPVT